MLRGVYRPNYSPQQAFSQNSHSVPRKWVLAIFFVPSEFSLENSLGSFNNIDYTNAK